MTKADLKSTVMDLCGEDYYGIWEIYWNYQEPRTDDVDDDLFMAVLEELVTAEKIVPYDKNKYTNEFDRATFDLARLRSELDDIKSGQISEQFYWFSCV